MSTISLPYDHESVLTFDVKESNLAWVAHYGTAKKQFSTQEQIILNALANPIGSLRLSDLATPDKKVAIIVDDITRPTPVSTILPYVLRELKEAGVDKKHINLVMALGTHRRMTDEEIKQRCGPLDPDIQIINVNHTEADQFVNVGVAPCGAEIVVLKAVALADLKIGIGNIVPHMYAGWGGGAKIIQPGVCAKSTTEATHTLGVLKDNLLNLCTNPENIVRHEMEKIAAIVGLDFIINTVLDENKELISVFAGDYIEAHRAGVRFAEKIYRPTVSEMVDIGVITCYPSFLDYRQGIKALIHAQYGVKPGGVVVLAMSAPEGIAGGDHEHARVIMDWVSKSEEQIRKGILERSDTDLIAMAFSLCHRQMINRAKTITISTGLEKDLLSTMGFIPAASMAEAMIKAKTFVGENAKIGVVTSAGIAVRQ